MMSETLTVPGVYIEECNALSMSIHSGETAIPVFIGNFNDKDGKPYSEAACIRVESWLEFTNKFGHSDKATVTLNQENTGVLQDNGKQPIHIDHRGSYSVRLYFENGGGPCYILPLSNTEDPPLAALAAKIELCPDITLLCWCEYTKKDKDVYGALGPLLNKNYFLLADAIEEKKDVLTNNSAEDLTFTNPFGGSTKAAVYFPVLQTSYYYETDDASIKVKELNTTGETWWEKSELTLSEMKKLSKEKIVKLGQALGEAQKNAANNKNLLEIAKGKLTKSEECYNGIFSKLEKEQNKLGINAETIDEIMLKLDETKEIFEEQANKFKLALVEAHEDFTNDINPLLEKFFNYLKIFDDHLNKIDSTSIEVGRNDIENDGVAEIEMLYMAQGIFEGNIDAFKSAFVEAQMNIIKIGEDNIKNANQELEKGNKQYKNYELLFNAIRRAIPLKSICLRASCAMAGIIARTDRERGVWKAPANVTLSGVKSLSIEPQQGMSTISPLRIDDALNTKLINAKINAIREFKGRGFLAWGARTATEPTDTNWLYIPVRRLFNAVERDISEALRSVAFEPNNAPTWERVRSAIDIYLHDLWRKGALMGKTPEEAYSVHLGLGVTMNGTDLKQGKMIVKVGMAAVRPAEFIELQFTQDMVS